MTKGEGGRGRSEGTEAKGSFGGRGNLRLAARSDLAFPRVSSRVLPRSRVFFVSFSCIFIRISLASPFPPVFPPSRRSPLPSHVRLQRSIHPATQSKNRSRGSCGCARRKPFPLRCPSPAFRVAMGGSRRPRDRLNRRRDPRAAHPLDGRPLRRAPVRASRHVPRNVAYLGSDDPLAVLLACERLVAPRRASKCARVGRNAPPQTAGASAGVVRMDRLHP